jgi:hypothetical protein
METSEINDKFTILVNSCDGFEDCWVPFFTLFEKKWKSCRSPILLNTEFKSFVHDGLSIKTSKSHQDTHDRKLTWSECLINALEMVDTSLVLYMQEDYFIQKPVQSGVIDDFVELMIKDSSIKHIGLTDHGSEPPFIEFNNDKRLCIIGQKAGYRISTQAGLWRKDALLSYLRPEENGWMFEIFGTKRAQNKKELFLTANRELYNLNQSEIISYVHTGIIKGKWHADIPRIFDENNVAIDFNIRGYYKEKPYIFRKIETAKKLVKNPIKFITGMLGY